MPNHVYYDYFKLKKSHSQSNVMALENILHPEWKSYRVKEEKAWM